MITSETLRAAGIQVAELDPSGDLAAFAGFTGKAVTEAPFPGGIRIYFGRGFTRLDRNGKVVQFIESSLNELGRGSWEDPEFAAMWRRIWDLQEVLEAMAEAHKAQVKAILGF